MADDGNLSAALSDSGGSSAGPAPAPAAPTAPDISSSGPPSGTGTSSNLGGAIQPSNPAPPAADLPRFQRTFGNTLKGILLGFGMGNIAGAVQGGVDPQAPIKRLQQQHDTAAANVTFASARAAHEVAMAHQADVEYQALPEKLQQEAEGRGLENMTRARQAGYLPIATVPLDQGQDQNSQGAMTALNSVKQQFGAVPSGLLYVHTGSGMTVMKLQDPAAALTTINQARRAQGMPEIQQDAFMQLKPDDRDSMARDAINFADPRDINGMVTQNSINIATMRLATVKAQPEFNGKDALVKSLQQTVDHQKAVLDSGAQAEAQRKGQAVGTEATAAQPGQTAAKVKEINATAGPEANAAGAKAEAVAKGTAKGQLEGSGLVNPPGSEGLSGEAYLKTLPQSTQQLFQSVAEGRNKEFQVQNRKGEMTPVGQAFIRAFPDYDIGKAHEYPKLVQEFTTGQTGKAIVAMGTAINHARAAYDNTGASSFIPGTAENKRYNADATFVSEELGKYLKGGVATEGEVKAIQEGVKSHVPWLRKAALENAAHIIEGRRSELQQQWTNGQVRPSYQPPMPNVSREAEANFAYLQSGGKVTPIYANAPGKPRLQSLDGGKSWQPAQ